MPLSQDILDQYCAKGFGSMNKNDFEVFIFNELLSSRFIEKNDYEISLELQIPVSKVKRLRYEASLKYPIERPKDYYVELFKRSLKGARYEDNFVVFQLENIAARQFLRDELMKKGNFFDSSFNSDIVKIKYNDFWELLLDLCFDDKDKKRIEKDIEKHSDKKGTKEKIYEALKCIGRHAIDGATSAVAGLGIDYLIEILKNIIL